MQVWKVYLFVSICKFREILRRRRNGGQCKLDKDLITVVGVVLLSIIVICSCIVT